jgi:hypothetical protein
MIGGLALGSVSCSVTPADPHGFRRELSVVAVLTNQTPQRFFVWYTATGEEREQFVSHAQVQVRSAAQEVAFRLVVLPPELGGGDYYTDGQGELDVVPGAEYGLTVIVDQDTITGVARVPESFQILSPAEGDSIRVRGIFPYTSAADFEARWEACPGAYGYLINLISQVFLDDLGGGHYFTSRSYWNDETTQTSFNVSAHAGRSGEYTLKVMAYDRNYRSHFFESVNTAGIEGGYGVFASAWVDSVTIAVVK